MNSNSFVDKPFTKVEGGYYDETGFYYTPNGSFWDPDGIYFNNQGYDKHGGRYNQFMEYIPGEGWIEELLCYDDEKEDLQSRFKHRGEEDIHLDADDIFDELDYDKILEEEERKFNKIHHIDIVNHEKKQIEIPKSVIDITPEMLFNKIPEDKQQRKEKKIELDSLFD